MRTLECVTLHEGDRSKGLGGSETSVVAALNPHTSPFDVWLDKTGRQRRELVENQYIRWGLLKEAVIANHYASRHNVRFAQFVNPHTGTLSAEGPRRRHPKYEHLMVSADRLIRDPDGDGAWDPVSECVLLERGLEVKTGIAKHRRKWGPSGLLVENFEDAKGVVPLYYWTQCQTYMDAFGFPVWDICVLLDSSEYREFRLLYDQAWCDEHLARANEWYATHVIGDKEPELDWGDSVNKYLTSLYPADNGEIREATAKEEALVVGLKELDARYQTLRTEYGLAKDALAAAEEVLLSVGDKLGVAHREKASIAALLRASIAGHAGVKTKEGDVTWRAASNGRRTLRTPWAKGSRAGSSAA